MEPTQEELAAEQAMAQVPKEEEIRAKVISDFGFDETDDAERIDKIVAERMESHKKLSQAIGQKIKHREDAERLRTNPPKPAEVKEPEFSPKDYLALIEAKVTSEDYEEVLRVAKVLGKPVSEALKDTTLKTILATRAEERATANATQTKGARGAAPTTGESLLQEAEQKEMVPDDDAGIQKLAEARIAARQKK